MNQDSKQSRKAEIIGLILGIIFSPIAIFFALESAGAGHGNYHAAFLLFPLPMICMALGPIVMIPLALVQYPIYGWLIGTALRRSKGRIALFVLLALHLGLLAFGFSLNPL